MQKGKFIVIDGTDGSGKGTQTDLLIAALQAQGKQVVKIAFPRHGQPSAWFVDQYLNGKFGSISEVGPYQASVFYALDRYAVATEIRQYLKLGKIVIADRYVSSNLGHQGAKIINPLERKKFYTWANNFEYNILNLPQPDLTIILHMPAAVAQKLVDQKGHRDYVGGNKRDLHEGNLEHLQAAEKVYLELVEQFGFTLIECFTDGAILTREQIQYKILENIKSVI
jgi:dTMP kinase